MAEIDRRQDFLVRPRVDDGVNESDVPGPAINGAITECFVCSLGAIGEGLLSITDYDRGGI